MNKPIFKGTISAVIAVVVNVVFPCAAIANLDDGLLWVFRAKDGIVNGGADMSNFRDQLTVSAVSTKTLTFQSVSGHEPYLTNMTVKAGIENATYENQACLYLNQPTNRIDGTFHVYHQRAKLPSSLLATSTNGVSFFARIKWDGSSRKGSSGTYVNIIEFFQNGNDWQGKGWGVELNEYGGGAAGNSWIQAVVGTKQVVAKDANIVSDESQWTEGKFIGNSCGVYKNEGWTDIGVTMRSVSGEGKTYVTIFRCPSGAHSVSIARTFVNRLLAAPSLNDGLSYIFGNETGDKTGAGNVNFRGAVREVRLWNRCLSEEEMRMVFAGQQQGWSIGAENDSANEFSDTECVGTFNPRTMSWSKMRKTLTSANPSVTITSTFPIDRRNLPRVLHIKPILSAEAAGGKLDVSLNGTNIGTVKLRSGDNWFFVKERVFSRLVGNDGVATFTLARSGNMAGTVMFDSLELTGSFQIGKSDNVNADGSFSEFTWVQDRNHELYSTVEDIKIYPANISPNKGIDIYFPLRQAVADHYKFRFSTHLFWQTEAQLPLTFKLNGVAIQPTGESTPDRTFDFDIEPGVLQECNKFTIRTGATTRTDSGDKDYAIDYYRLDVINTDKKGICLSFH